MGNSTYKSFNRSNKRRFVGIPRNVFEHDDFKLLSPTALKLLLDIHGQYNGFNNGDFTIAMSVLKKRGWNSNSQLYRARRELLDKNLIMMTRQGGKNRCSLYAVTWECIDYCQGKLEVSPTRTCVRIFATAVPV